MPTPLSEAVTARRGRRVGVIAAGHPRKLGRNLLWTVPGNIVGGGLLVGVADSWLNGAAPATLRRRRPAAGGLAGDASADGEGDAALTAVEPEGERPGEPAAEPAAATAAARPS
ncbi:MAG: hypothetical protein BRC31_06880 [Actinobacteria bacterium QS_5_72_10]|nr:MAG: hypothetical protein BRC31_06880 [Actinobacteria bacterium QS_5_72_10]